jgi:hypothetical protein
MKNDQVTVGGALNVKFDAVNLEIGGGLERGQGVFGR